MAEEIIRKLNALGFILHSAQQWPNNIFHVTVRRPDTWMYYYGEGASLSEALLATKCLDYQPLNHPPKRRRLWHR